MKSIRLKTWHILQGDPSSGALGKIVNVSLVSLITLNVIGVVAETVPSISASYEEPLKRFEFFSVGIFAIEYFVRLWASAADPRFRRRVTGRIRYALTPIAIIDFVAIFPFYLPYLKIDLTTLRLIRLIRLIRILKLGRHSDSLQLVVGVLKEKRRDLASTALVATVLLMISASLLHTVEAGSQPEQFGSLPDCMWWAAVTMTTVGYGDVYPKTPMGKVLGAFVAFIGIGMFALPTGILGAGFLEARMKRASARDAKEMKCPHCGRTIGRTGEKVAT